MAPSPRTKKIILHPQHKESARIQVMLIAHHQAIIASLKRELIEQVERDYGVDLTSGEWHLNTADGRLERTASPAVQGG